MSVKEKKRGRPAKKHGSLSQCIIIEQAKSLMLNNGKAPSIRQLSSSLNVDAMAIYHYFKNKDALLEAITTSLIGDIYEPKKSDDWKKELEYLCHSYLQLLNQYSDLLETLLSMKSAGPAIVFRKRFNEVIYSLNLDKDSADNALALLVDYLHGFALAMKCNKQEGQLRVDMIAGPLNLYCNAIQIGPK